MKWFTAVTILRDEVVVADGFVKKPKNLLARVLFLHHGKKIWGGKSNLEFLKELLIRSGYSVKVYGSHQRSRSGLLRAVFDNQMF